MSLKRSKIYRILAVLSACSIIYIYSNRSIGQRTLSENHCKPVQECPEGEEAYFKAHPDVAKLWKPERGSAYSYWKAWGEREGKEYFCKCPDLEHKDDSDPEEHKGRFVVAGVFKNEAMIFEEWISHYLWQGASHFYLFDNGSTDDWKSKMAPAIMDKVTVTRDEARHSQTALYNSLIPMLREKHPNDWVLVVDFDEFIYARSLETIRSYLSKVSDDIGKVLIHWKMFGSNGFESQPKNVRCSFTKCGHVCSDFNSRVEWKSNSEESCPFHINVKGVARVSGLDRLHIHAHMIKAGFR